MLAAYCDGCMKEIVSDNRLEMASWMSEHYDHYRTWSMDMSLTDQNGTVVGQTPSG